MLCVPSARVEVVKVASPLVFRLEVPRFVVPSKKVRVPVGVILNPSPATVAVKVTACPTFDGFGREVSDVADAPRLVLMRTATSPGFWPQTLLAQFATTTSGLLSPFRSATATPNGVFPPGGKVTTG